MKILNQEGKAGMAVNYWVSLAKHFMKVEKINKHVASHFKAFEHLASITTLPSSASFITFQKTLQLVTFIIL